MYKEYEIEENLFYLQHLLLNLDCSFFDDEINDLISSLKMLIDSKLNRPLNTESSDIADYKLFVRYKIL